MSAKDVANRLFHFIGGLILALLGIILTIMMFSEKWNFTIFPFMMAFFGLGWIGYAFDKHKKAQNQAAVNPPSVQANNSPASDPANHLPPPVNKEMIAEKEKT